MSRNDGKILLGLLLAVVLAWGTGHSVRAAGKALDAAANAITAATDAAAPASGAASTAAAAPIPAPAPQKKVKDTAPTGRTVTITDAAGRKHVRMLKPTPIERQAAADRLTALKATAAPADPNAPVALSVGVGGGGTLPVPSFYRIADNGELVPDYSGGVANWANSPMPTLVTQPGVVVAEGNPVVAAAYATDTAPAVFVILPNPLPVGQVQSFQVYNQLGSGPSQITAYVLRPTANPNEYSVVHQTGLLDIPAIATAAEEGVLNFPLATPVDVQAGDLIAFYGKGVPLTIGGGSDILIYPPPDPASIAGTFTTATPFSLDRTYSFGAQVLDNSQSSSTITGGIRKFVNGLPGLGPGGANNIGQYIPVATADTTTYPGSEYYEIELGQYQERMHSDLPPTTLRGYRQTNMGGTPFHYLGPLIIAKKGTPVRVKFTNNLPTGAEGNLFIPVDQTVMGAGPGPNATRAVGGDLECAKWNPTAGAPTNGGAPPAACYTENRATIHLHGGVTPWISDGTTHQWITPAGETTAYPRGVSVYNVPDMPNPGKSPSPGVQTFYYTNDQSARLMFYHDHAHGITRLNVYVGEAAGYLLTDDTEQALMAAGGPLQSVGLGIPLIIQDKTFVDATTIRQQDPTWNWGTGITFTTLIDDNDTPGDPSDDRTMRLKDAVTGDLWWPHVYMPAQNPSDIGGMNAMGRWNYGPWFWPPTNGIAFGPVPNPYYDCNALGLPDATHPCTRPEQPTLNPGTPNPSWGAEAFLDTPVINGTAYPTLAVEPKAYRFRILNAAHDRFWNLQWYQADPAQMFTDPQTGATRLTEVRMVPGDGREGGVPDLALEGPKFLQIGTEGGFLPMPVEIPNQHITWNGDPLTFNFGNVKDHALLLGPAERADVIVDFSAYAGKTLILYNDAPAAFPALDPRNDYYTGNPDLTDQGGTPSTLAGYGPNIRTIMQVTVANTAPAPFDVAALMTRWAPDATITPARPGVFQESQDPVIVGQEAYNTAYSTLFPTVSPYWGYSNIYSTALSFMPAGVPCSDPNPVNCTVTLPMKAKAIQDEMGETFDDYGRMRSSLGLTLAQPLANGNNFILQGYADPPTELIKLSNIDPSVGSTMIGSLDDGTQIWKITHNGVDTHPVHFHLFHVQLVNRVGWDNAIRLPDANELGWKDTVRISPLEDTIVALRPISPNPTVLPFQLPNSMRPIEPALPVNYQWDGFDPLGNPITVTNVIGNFGWEYVWHCHILSHEENDMMRAVVFAYPPNPPTNLRFSASRTLAWTDNSSNESGFEVLRATDQNFTANVVSTLLGPNVTTYRTPAGNYRFKVRAVNTVGSGVPGYPMITAESPWSNFVDQGTVPVAPAAPSAPTNLTGVSARTNKTSTVTLTWVDTSNNETGFQLQESTNANFNGAVSVSIPANTQTITRKGLTRLVTYYYRIRAVNNGVNSGWSNTFSIVTQ